MDYESQAKTLAKRSYYRISTIIKWHTEQLQKCYLQYSWLSWISLRGTEINLSDRLFRPRKSELEIPIWNDKWLNSDKDMNIEYNDVKNIAAAEFAISRDIAMIDIQMNPQRND